MFGKACFPPLLNIKHYLMNMADNTYLSTEEVAKLLNVHINTVARWIKSGKLPQQKSVVITAFQEKLSRIA